jgi:hypothetical protein
MWFSCGEAVEDSQDKEIMFHAQSVTTSNTSAKWSTAAGVDSTISRDHGR